jgi:hypothetical protein
MGRAWWAKPPILTGMLAAVLASGGIGHRLVFRGYTHGACVRPSHPRQVVVTSGGCPESFPGGGLLALRGGTEEVWNTTAVASANESFAENARVENSSSAGHLWRKAQMVLKVSPDGELWVQEAALGEQTEEYDADLEDERLIAAAETDTTRLLDVGEWEIREGDRRADDAEAVPISAPLAPPPALLDSQSDEWDRPLDGSASKRAVRVEVGPAQPTHATAASAAEDAGGWGSSEEESSPQQAPAHGTHAARRALPPPPMGGGGDAETEADARLAAALAAEDDAEATRLLLGAAPTTRPARAREGLHASWPMAAHSM